MYLVLGKVQSRHQDYFEPENFALESAIEAIDMAEEEEKEYQEQLQLLVNPARESPAVQQLTPLQPPRQEPVFIIDYEDYVDNRHYHDEGFLPANQRERL